MEWTNIHRSTLQSDVMLEVDPADGWTWLLLLSYCQAQENGGRIAGAAKWSNRAWLRACGLEAAAVKRDCPLWRWEGDDLWVEFYPLGSEAKLKKQRRGGAMGASRRWHPKDPNPMGNPLANLVGKAMGNPLAKAEGNPMGELMGKEREGKETKEKEREEARSNGVGLEAEIPSLAEVLSWASSGAGVDPAYAEKKWADANERHAWVANGQLVDWRKRWLRFWLEDREAWLAKKKNAAPGGGVPYGQAVRAGDADWWWTEPLETVGKALTGALLGADPTAERLREVLEARRAYGK